MLGEVGDAQQGLEILGEYTAGDERAHMCYAFEFLGVRIPMTPDWIQQTFAKLQDVAPDGWACWAFSNHDVVRHKSRWNLSDEAVKAFNALMMCMRGSTCIYQGEELGFSEAEVPFEALQDPYGIEFWPEFKGRDGCRTPMVWDANAKNGGFSDADTWLPVAPSQLPKEPSVQVGVAGSMHSHYRNTIAMRHAYAALAQGELANMQANGNVLTFERKLGNEEIFCAFNLSEEQVMADMPAGQWQSVEQPLAGLVAPTAQVNLAPWQYVIAMKTK